jgi:hypothetical protein
VAAMETRFYPSEASDACGAQSGASMAVSRYRARSLVQRLQFALEFSLPHLSVRAQAIDLAAGYSAVLLVGFMNRRMRNARPVAREDEGANPPPTRFSGSFSTFCDRS